MDRRCITLPADRHIQGCWECLRGACRRPGPPRWTPEKTRRSLTNTLKLILLLITRTSAVCLHSMYTRETAPLHPPVQDNSWSHRETGAKIKQSQIKCQKIKTFKLLSPKRYSNNCKNKFQFR